MTSTEEQIESIRRRHWAWWRGTLLGLAGLAAGLRPLAAQIPGIPVDQGLAGYAKVLCSAVFVSGREPDEAAQNSAFFFLSETDRRAITDRVVDRENRLVRVTWRGTITRTAKYYGDQGCVIHPPGIDRVFFEPVAVHTTLPDADALPWPMGDGPVGARTSGVDQAKLDAGVERAFAPAALTAAMVVVYRGRIVAERYAQGAGKDTQLESWSMGKSLTATLAGVLVADGEFGLWDPAPVPEWRAAADPRSSIRVADLLRMSSGLRFLASQDPDYSLDKGYPDHFYIYTGAIDAFAHSYTRGVQFPPNAEGRYRNSDPLTIGYIIQQTVRRRGEEYLTFPQRALFDRIGIRKMVLETDPYGNFIMSGYDYGTARNWARLGLLYLHDGMWDGKRILPEGWVTFVSTPAPAWSRPQYGGFFWLNRIGQWNAPEDAFYMAGHGSQFTFIIPSRDLVVVRMGHVRGGGPGQTSFNEALKLIVESVEGGYSP